MSETTTHYCSGYNSWMGKFNIKDEADFEKTKADAEAFYATVGKVYCPYFKEKIAFNAKGLRHLKFKSDQVARTQEDQYTRLKLIRLAPMVLQDSKTVQGISEIRRFEMQKINSRWENVLKEVTFYEFAAVIDTVRVKVIIKCVAGGIKHFWSVIPYWRIDKQNSKRILHNLDHEND